MLDCKHKHAMQDGAVWHNNATEIGWAYETLAHANTIRIKLTTYYISLEHFYNLPDQAFNEDFEIVGELEDVAELELKFPSEQELTFFLLKYKDMI